MSDRLVEVSAASAPASSDVATMRVLSPSAPPSAAPSVAAPDGSPSTPNQRTVAPGDSFWSIASDALADAAGRPMGDREVVAYWRQLVDANRGNLVVPGDVDLIFAGQVVQLPPITAT
jgi:nucleoid-associated protein YgaU